LSPQFGTAWEDWCQTKGGIEADMVTFIAERMNALNEEIDGDRSLGPQYRIGHSYVTPLRKISMSPKLWFRQVVETEIAPLLEEYWFDAVQKAEEAKVRLLSGLND
jgi:5-methylcytosine-specific restriction protein B